MSFAREKRLLLGLMALCAPVPLPFNGNLAWPVLVAFEALVVVFLIRAYDGTDRWLPDWALNVLGGLYLPVLLLDLFSGGRAGLLGPILHLTLFVLLVKLAALRRERDKWQVLLGLLFVFLAAMGTSVHPAVVLYMGLMVGLFTLALLRFAQWSLLAGVARSTSTSASTELPAGRIVVVATLIAMVMGVPLFALLPRISSPFLTGRGQGTGTIIQAAGFTDVVSLDVIGSIRESREVVLRISSEGPPLDDESLRLKAATYGFYDGRTWRREGGGRPLFRDESKGAFALAERPAEQPVVRRARAWLQPLGSASLPVPLRAVELGVGTIPTLEEDAGGALRSWLPLSGTTELQWGLAASPRRRRQPPTEELTQDPRYLGGLTPRMEVLARQVAGEGTPLERAERLERHLITEYSYTTEFVGVSGAEAIEEFLFDYRRGHCEYFASALVVLLRAEGIPSRLVTGFLGGDYNPIEGYYVVRQLNAHAWVEAWDELGEQWITLDPTPAAGRPQSGVGAGWDEILRQSWDYLLFRWDRYVLTFGLEDQLGLLRQLRTRWEELVEFLRGKANSSDPDPVDAAAAAAAESGLSTDPAGSRVVPWAIGLVLVLIAASAVAWVLARRARGLGPVEAYRRLRRDLERSGIPIGAATAPLELERVAVRALPSAALAVRRLVRDYLRVAFAGETTTGDALVLRQCLDLVRREARAKRQGR